MIVSMGSFPTMLLSSHLSKGKSLGVMPDWADLGSLLCNCRT